MLNAKDMIFIGGLLDIYLAHKNRQCIECVSFGWMVHPSRHGCIAFKHPRDYDAKACSSFKRREL